jgi:hypothetical protein
VSFSSWSFPRLALFWSIAAFVALVCWRVGEIRAPDTGNFACLAPHQGTPGTIVRSIFVGCRDFFLVRPWQATAEVGVPLVVLVVTISWGVSRLSR